MNSGLSNSFSPFFCFGLLFSGTLQPVGENGQVVLDLAKIWVFLCCFRGTNTGPRYWGSWRLETTIVEVVWAKNKNTGQGDYRDWPYQNRWAPETSLHARIVVNEIIRSTVHMSYLQMQSLAIKNSETRDLTPSILRARVLSTPHCD